MSLIVRGSSMKISPDEFSTHNVLPLNQKDIEGRNQKSSLPKDTRSKSSESGIPGSKRFMTFASKTESMLNYVRSKRVNVEDNNGNIKRNSKDHKEEFLKQEGSTAKLVGGYKIPITRNSLSFSDENNAYYDSFLRFSLKKEKTEEEFRSFRAEDVNITLGTVVTFWTVAYFFLRSSVFSLWYLDHMNISFLINFILAILALISCAFVAFNRLAMVSKPDSILYSYKENSVIRMNSYGQYVEDSLVYFSAVIPSLNLLGRVLMGPCDSDLPTFRLQVDTYIYNI
jgi:hypothetical protein